MSGNASSIINSLIGEVRSLCEENTQLREENENLKRRLNWRSVQRKTETTERGCVLQTCSWNNGFIIHLHFPDSETGARSCVPLRGQESYLSRLSINKILGGQILLSWRNKIQPTVISGALVIPPSILRRFLQEYVTEDAKDIEDPTSEGDLNDQIVSVAEGPLVVGL